MYIQFSCCTCEQRKKQKEKPIKLGKSLDFHRAALSVKIKPSVIDQPQTHINRCCNTFHTKPVWNNPHRRKNDKIKRIIKKKKKFTMSSSSAIHVI